MHREMSVFLDNRLDAELSLAHRIRSLCALVVHSSNQGPHETTDGRWTPKLAPEAVNKMTFIGLESVLMTLGGPHGSSNHRVPCRLGRG